MSRKGRKPSCKGDCRVMKKKTDCWESVFFLYGVVLDIEVEVRNESVEVHQRQDDVDGDAYEECGNREVAACAFLLDGDVDYQDDHADERNEA